MGVQNENIEHTLLILMITVLTQVQLKTILMMPYEKICVIAVHIPYKIYCNSCLNSVVYTLLSYLNRGWQHAHTCTHPHAHTKKTCCRHNNK